MKTNKSNPPPNRVRSVHILKDRRMPTTPRTPFRPPHGLPVGGSTWVLGPAVGSLQEDRRGDRGQVTVSASEVLPNSGEAQRQPGNQTKQALR